MSSVAQLMPLKGSSPEQPSGIVEQAIDAQLEKERAMIRQLGFAGLATAISDCELECACIDSMLVASESPHAHLRELRARLNVRLQILTEEREGRPEYKAEHAKAAEYQQMQLPESLETRVFAAL